MIPRNPVQSPLTVARRFAALVLVALLAVPVVQAANRLRMVVDGDVVQVLSFEQTVGDLLEEQGVVLAAGDEVLPAPATPLDAVHSVTILRTIEVALDVDGTVTTHRGTWRTVEGLLAEEGVELTAGQVLRPAPRTPLADGDTVTITSPREVAVVADGAIQHHRTHLATVGELLASAGVAVGAEDILTPAADTPVTDGLEVVVQRVEFQDVVEEVSLPFEEERRPTDDLFEGQTRVAREGVPGVRHDTYRVRVIDGEGVERELLSEEVVSEPTTRIVEYGTVPRPSQSYIDDGSVWYDLARCESGLNWDHDGTYDGGLQMHPDTWTRNKPSGYPKYAWMATPEQQIEVGKIIQRRSGWGAWPHCARELGLI